MKNKKIFITIIIILLVIILSVLVFFLIRNFTNTDYNEFINDNTSPTTQSVTKSSEDVNEPTELPTVENPVDFTELQKINTDAYAWIKVPNTNIDYPIMQSFYEDDLFYLEHNIYKEYEFAGSIYTEKINNRDFLDPNTVIYGHDMLNGSMFQNLHKFSDNEFFNENEYFYIYTPARKLTYQVFSAYVYDNRHILNSFDFSDKEVFQGYIDEATNPRSVDANTRDVEVTTDDKIVTLSTCVGYDKNLRYLVQGVLIKDEQAR